MFLSAKYPVRISWNDERARFDTNYLYLRGCQYIKGREKVVAILTRNLSEVYMFLVPPRAATPKG